MVGMGVIPADLCMHSRVLLVAGIIKFAAAFGPAFASVVPAVDVHPDKWATIIPECYASAEIGGCETTGNTAGFGPTQAAFDACKLETEKLNIVLWTAAPPTAQDWFCENDAPDSFLAAMTAATSTFTFNQPLIDGSTIKATCAARAAEELDVEGQTSMASNSSAVQPTTPASSQSALQS